MQYSERKKYRQVADGIFTKNFVRTTIVRAFGDPCPERVGQGTSGRSPRPQSAVGPGFRIPDRIGDRIRAKISSLRAPRGPLASAERGVGLGSHARLPAALAAGVEEARSGQPQIYRVGVTRRPSIASSGGRWFYGRFYRRLGEKL